MFIWLSFWIKRRGSGTKDSFGNLSRSAPPPLLVVVAKQFYLTRKMNKLQPKIGAHVSVVELGYLSTTILTLSGECI